MNETEHIYDDKKEQRFYAILFWIFEISMLLITGSFIYASVVGISSLIAKRGLSVMAYTPEVVLSMLYLYGAYIGWRRFQKGRWLSGVGVVMGISSLVIVLLWVHLSKMV
jgi:hypothetical protein